VSFTVGRQQAGLAGRSQSKALSDGYVTIDHLPPSRTETARLAVAVALLYQFSATVKPGRRRIADIDDTFCTAHLMATSWHSGMRVTMSAALHIYRVASGIPMAAILHLARKLKGTEIRIVVKHVTQRAQATGPTPESSGTATAITAASKPWNGREYYYIFGFRGNAVLERLGRQQHYPHRWAVASRHQCITEAYIECQRSLTFADTV
jgi:hypothetical protein